MESKNMKVADSAKNQQVRNGTGKFVGSNRSKIEHRKPWFRMRYQTTIEGESLTEQSHKKSVDVNAIIARYARTGELPGDASAARYGDVSAMNNSYQEVIDESNSKVRTAAEFVDNWEPEKPTQAAPEGEPPAKESSGGTEKGEGA